MNFPELLRFKEDRQNSPIPIWFSLTSPAFDISLLEFLCPILLGGELVLGSDEAKQNGEVMLKELQESGSTILQLTPSGWLQLQRLGSIPHHLELAFCGGEAMPPQLAAFFQRFRSSPIGVLQMYGPTEATIWATASRFLTLPMDGAEKIIGPPMANTSVSLDGEELFLAGPAIARGYFNDPDLTRQKFSPSPDLHGHSTYATGDAARYNDAGQLEFLGRLDSQVKLNGHRIELCEIECCLAKHESVHQCAVLLDNEVARIVAFVVPQFASLDERPLRQFAGRQLESYKVPAEFRQIANLPLTVSGKVDRNSLRDWLVRPVVVSNCGLAGVEGDMKNKLQKVVASLIPSGQIGLEDDFLKHGFTSLMAVEASQRLRAMGLAVSPQSFFELRTCASLSAEMAKTETSGEGNASSFPRLSPTQTSGLDVVGLSLRAGKSGCYEELWANLEKGVDCITDFSEQQLRSMGVPEAEYTSPDYVSSKGVIVDFACFDPEAFLLSNQEAQLLSPHFRCFLEGAAHVLEDGGYDLGGLSRRKIGVFAGMGENDYLKGGFSSAQDLSVDLGNNKDFLAGRVSYHLDLCGPSMNIQTACSTGLVAILQATNGLDRAGGSNMEAALAGAVSLAPLSPGYVASAGLQFSRRGRCRTFAADADGIVVGLLAFA